VDNDGTPYGWAFENFYNVKDFVKDLTNRSDALIFLGGLQFKSFSNLTTRWVKSLLVGGCLWVIHIDTTMDGVTFLLQHLMKQGKQSFTKQFRKQMPQSKGRSNIN
jgi:hypothetical protein